MNRTYKVIWSKARHCYVVVSELTKSQHKSSSKSELISTNVHRGGVLGKAAVAAIVAGLLTFGGVAYSPVLAADNTAGSGDGVAVGTGSSAPKAENVAIGKGATISYSGGVGQPSTGDIVIGGGAHINNYIDQGGGIAIGANSFVENMTGGLERSFDFKQAGYNSFFGIPYGLPKDPTKMVTGVAVGQNTYARSGSIMLGTHNYKGDLGDVTVDSANTKAQNMSLFSTTLGANSYSNGLFSSVTGAYSIASSNYSGDEHASKNFGATITGSLNSIESATSSNEYSGVANSIVGLANRTSNSNGSLIFGAGNEIKNSITNISAPTSGGDSSKALQDRLMKAVKKSESGGATLVIGGGNVADYTQKTQILGVDNTVNGVENNISKYNMVDGFNNTVNGASHLYTIGTNNTITNAKNTILFGDDYKNASGLADSVIIGNNRVKGDEKAEFAYFNNQKNIVSIGNKNVLNRTDGSISIGNNNFMWRSGGQPEKYGYDTGNVAIGNNTYINSYLNQGDSIVIGKNATVINMGGSLEKAFAFGTPEGKDYSGSIAIGQNSYARSGSTMIGIHNYQGKLGDLDIDFTKDKSGGHSGIGEYQESIDATTIGNNSFNNGTFATVTGAYSATTAKKKTQNFAATVDGSLNSIESYKDAADNSGVASSIVGTANRIANSNNTTIIGAGNEVTNSLTDIKAPTEGGASAKALQDTLKDTLQNDAKGAVVVSGIGNKVDSANSISLSGSRNTVKNTKNAQLFGDNREVTNSNGVIIIGSADKTLKTTNVQNSTIIGHNANAQNDALAVGESASAGNTGIAIGMKANAGYGQNMALGYYAKVENGVQNSTALGYGSQVTKRDILKSDGKDGVISVGKSVGQSGEAGMTRRIINVKAGVNDTDAVNVSQLKQQAQAATTEVMAGTNIASVTKNDKTPDGHTIYTVNAKGTTMSSGDNNFDIMANPNGTTNVTDYKISLKNTITIGNGAETHPITINGTDGVISGLINTTWDKNTDYSQSTKAATEAQLQQAMNDAQKAAEANDTDTHVKAGEYAVDTKHQVSMDIVDKEGKSTGNKITITDVAKASDVGDVKKLDADIQNADGKTTVVDAVNKVNGKVGDLNYSSTKYVTKGDSVTTSIGKLDEAIKSASEAAGKHTIVSTKDANLSVDNIAKVGEAANYQISMNKDLNVDSVTAANKIKTKDLEVTDSATIGKVTINKDNKGTIGGLTNKTWDAKNITSGQAATEDQLQAATKNAVNYDGDDSKTVTLREDTTIQNVANTTIEEGSKNAVNAGTVYNETRVAKDGNFVKQSNTAGENLAALDNQVTANTESIYHMNGRISDLDNRVNKVGAGAAALAALHPLDFDPDDKWDFAVGYGNYRNANSVALGAFYRPNEDTMFSLGTNFGNGENMFNAGLSFKIGQGGSGITTSKTAMAKKIESLENTVDQQDKKIAELEALVKEQGEMIRQYVGKK